MTGMKADLSFIKRERMKVAISHGSINLESIGRVKVGDVYTHACTWNDRFDRAGVGGLIYV